MKLNVLPAFLVVIGISMFMDAPAHAQATRTWVSGVGDDASPCSRTSPCKTFAGAISKTVANGEINCIDPGGFGALTITKAITIDCSNTFASVLVVGTNGIVINTANATDKVTIRGLEIQGEGAGLDALRIIKAGQVAIDKVTIQGFTGNGVNVANIANAADVFVTNSYITGVATGINATATAGTYNSQSTKLLSPTRRQMVWRRAAILY